MTHELIANMLGVRRESVTEAAGRLQKAGLIHYHRGHVAVLDRTGLEARVCECYQVVKAEYHRLLSSPGHGPAISYIRAVPHSESRAAYLSHRSPEEAGRGTSTRPAD